MIIIKYFYEIPTMLLKYIYIYTYIYTYLYIYINSLSLLIALKGGVNHYTHFVDDKTED